MKTLCRLLWVPAVLLAATTGWAEILVTEEAGVPPAAEEGYTYQHPKLRSLVFSSPESRGQAILPPAPYFVPPPALLWRAPGGASVYPPIVLLPPAINGSGRLSTAEMARYNLARAHAMRQGLYKNSLWFGSSGVYQPGIYAWPHVWGWVGSPLVPLSPPAAAGQAHPSNRDNANYLLERAHRFSTDAYRTP